MYLNIKHELMGDYNDHRKPVELYSKEPGDMSYRRSFTQNTPSKINVSGVLEEKKRENKACVIFNVGNVL